MSARPGIAQASHKRQRPRHTLSWQEHANCADSDPRMFFTPARYAEAVAVCRGCIVMMACRQYGKSSEGVWGGQINAAKS